MIMLHYAYMLYIFRLFYAFCDWFWNKNIIPAHNKAATKMSERRTALREADQDDMIMQYDHCCIIHTILHSLLNLVAPCSDTFVKQYQNAWEDSKIQIERLWKCTEEQTA